MWAASSQIWVGFVTFVTFQIGSRFKPNILVGFVTHLSHFEMRASSKPNISRICHICHISKCHRRLQRQILVGFRLPWRSGFQHREQHAPWRCLALLFLKRIALRKNIFLHVAVLSLKLSTMNEMKARQSTIWKRRAEASEWCIAGFHLIHGIELSSEAADEWRM